MKRVAFSMRLKEGFEAEYKKRHDEIWPELVKEIEEAGIYDYSIYLEKKTLILFGFHKLKDHNSAGDLASKKIVQKWWEYMGDLMATNPDGSPMQFILNEVFHMD